MTDVGLLPGVLRDMLAAGCTPSALAAAEERGWAPGLWDRLSDSGLTLIGVPERYAGPGGGLSDAAIVLYACGWFGVPLPIAETMLAGRLLAAVGVASSAGPMSVALDMIGPAPRVTRGLQVRWVGHGWQLRGELGLVPWAGQAERTIATAVAGDRRVLLDLPTDRLEVCPGRNVAGEPRDHVAVDAVVDANCVHEWPTELAEESPLLDLALARAIALCAALDRVQALTIAYASTREQFGRAIGGFQAVQHLIVAVARESEMARHGVLPALRAEESPAEITLRTRATAKAVASAAAGRAAAAAHQVHGAIGITSEYPLSWFTRRLLAWRDECGSEHYWHQRLGSCAAAQSPSTLWPFVTDH